MRSSYTSPWSTGLKILTSLILLVLAYVVWIRGLATVVAVAAVVLTCAAFAIRGYRIDGGVLFVQRPGWSKRFQVKELQGVEVAPDAMKGSLRVFGIAGLFAYIGFFRNSRLKWYRAYATDPSRSVVLRFPAGPVVVTPDDPEEFARSIIATKNALAS